MSDHGSTIPTRTAPIDPTDKLRLDAFDLKARGYTEPEIAGSLGLTLDLVRTLIAEDAAEFPDEPLLRRQA